MCVYNRLSRPTFQESWSRTVALPSQKVYTRSSFFAVTYYTDQVLKVLSNHRIKT